MDNQTTLWIVGGIALLLGGSILFLFLKGLLKLVFFFAAIIGGVLTYLWLTKNGAAYLAFITESTEPWMVTAISLLGSVTVFAVILQGSFWIGGLFSWGKNKGSGGFKGVLISVLMFGVVLWLVCIGVVHYGSLADMKRYVEIASDMTVRENIPMLTKGKKIVESNALLSKFEAVNPFNDPERLKLAKVIAYTAAEKNPAKLLICYTTLDKQLPYVNRLRKLAMDPTIQKYIEKKDMGALLGDPKLTKILSEDKMRGSLKTFNPDSLFGMQQ